MKKFMILYYSTAAGIEEMKNKSPEEMSEVKEDWFAWKDECGDAIVDFGGPLMGGEVLSSAEEEPANKTLISYSIIQGESMDDAKGLIETHPHIGSREDASIELYEIHALPSRD